jgi:hypothetical protein
MICGLVWLTRLDSGSEYASALLGPMAVLGIGGGLGFVPLMPVIMHSVPPQDAGAAGGALQTMQQTGAALGLAVLVTVFGSVVRHATPGPDAIVSGMTSAFAVAAGIASCALLVALTFRPVRSG